MVAQNILDWFDINKLDEKYKQANKKALEARQEWEEKHPIISGIQKDYQPGYRAAVPKWEQAAKYGMNAPLIEQAKTGLKEFGLNLVPSVNIAVDVATGGSGTLTKQAVKQAIAKPLVPYVGKQIAKNTAESLIKGAEAAAIGGATQGVTSSIADNGISKDLLSRPLLYGGMGLLTGGAFGGLGGFGAGQFGKYMAKKNLVGNPEAQMNFARDYLEGLNNNALTRQGFSINDIRGLKSGNYGNLAGDTLYNFIGENAFNAPKGKLMEAKQMAMYGDSNADIRNATGWFKGVDGKWRYEMPDGKLIEDSNVWKQYNSILGDTYEQAKLGDIYDNSELYQAYPRLKDLSVIKSKMPDGIDGMSGSNSIHIDNSLFTKHNPEYYKELDLLKQTPEIKRLNEIIKEARINGESELLEEEFDNILNNTENGKLYNSLVYQHRIPQKVDGWSEDALETIVHELQHQIQNIEGFARGGNSANPNYHKLAGEVEARLAGARAKLTPEQRQIYNPANGSTYLSNYGYDVIPEKQIVEYKPTPANSLNYRNEWVKIDGKDYRILNLPKKDYGKILHIVDTYLKPEDMIGEVIDWSDDLYKYTFQKVSPTDYKFIRRRKLK